MSGNFGFGIFLLWLVSGVLMMTGAAIAFIWALRSGQFKDQDRARYLALWSGIPKAGDREKKDTDTASGSDDSGKTGDSRHV